MRINQNGETDDVFGDNSSYLYVGERLILSQAIIIESALNFDGY